METRLVLPTRRRELVFSLVSSIWSLLRSVRFYSKSMTIAMANDFQLLNNSGTKAKPIESDSAVGLDESKLYEVVPKCGLDFEEWTSLISEIERKYPDVIEKISLVYDSFLSEFPLCHGYWRKYASHKTRLCSVDRVVDVFEQAVQSATYSVGIWVDYCSFSISAFEDPSDIRRLFKRAISFVGKDYLSYSLWDKYIEFEVSQQQWDSLALIYIQTLRFPTKKLSYYHNSFRKLTASLKENIQSDTGCNNSMPMEFEASPDSEVPTKCTDTELSSVIKDLLDLSAGTTRYSSLLKYVHAGEKLYDEACQLKEKIMHFEDKIRRTYFHVKPLDDGQLKNWHSYLDLVEMYGDFDWAVKLYERCLIPCASYPEFWMRYVEFVETKGGRELAMFALERATKTFLKKVPVIHLFNSRFKEQIRDLSGARAAFLQLDGDLDSKFVENIILKANMEKRMGKSTEAFNIYRDALQMALMKKKLDVLPALYVHFSRLKHMITGSVDAAMEVLIDGIRNVPLCKLLLEELINFVMVHGVPKLINLVDPIVANAISLKADVSQGWSEQDREDISTLYLKAVDLCGTIHDVMKVWNRHIKLFPQSIRAMPYKDPIPGIEAIKKTMGGKQTADSTVTNQPIRDDNVNPSNQPPLEENKESLLDNQNFKNDQSSNGNEPTSCLLVKHNIAMKESTIDKINLGDSEICAEEREQVNSPKVLERYGSGGNQIESAQMPMPMDNSKKDEYGDALGVTLKNLSIKSLSLNAKNNDKINLPSKACHEGEPPLENSLSSESVSNTDEEVVMHNPLNVGSSSSIQISNEGASPSSFPSPGKPTHPQVHTQFHMHETGDRKWHHKRHAGNLHHDLQHDFQGHSRRRPHRTWKDSPQDYRGMQSGQTSGDQDYTSETIASQKPQVERISQDHNHIQSAQQQQNFPTTSQSQLPSQGFTQEKSQNTTPNYEQYGHMQSSQVPNT
ncbi:pre-mRNA-processing factor 39 isoform X2 [Cucumis sativus]|uniref:pre-mRNA-processing factor 39 isoform X2 n=1 Tax=Cucumis sativus TaxID=3659 RepID=UPI0012F51E96|nr:pre-mRNA-processing factor 39 isoform X2 [Cucumis sativus]